MDRSISWSWMPFNRAVVLPSTCELSLEDSWGSGCPWLTPVSTLSFSFGLFPSISPHKGDGSSCLSHVTSGWCHTALIFQDQEWSFPYSQLNLRDQVGHQEEFLHGRGWKGLSREVWSPHSKEHLDVALSSLGWVSNSQFPVKFKILTSKIPRVWNLPVRFPVQESRGTWAQTLLAVQRREVLAGHISQGHSYCWSALCSLRGRQSYRELQYGCQTDLFHLWEGRRKKAGGTFAPGGFDG